MMPLSNGSHSNNRHAFSILTRIVHTHVLLESFFSFSSEAFLLEGLVQVRLIGPVGDRQLSINSFVGEHRETEPRGLHCTDKPPVCHKSFVISSLASLSLSALPSKKIDLHATLINYLFALSSSLCICLSLSDDIHQSINPSIHPANHLCDLLPVKYTSFFFLTHNKGEIFLPQKFDL